MMIPGDIVIPLWLGRQSLVRYLAVSSAMADERRHRLVTLQFRSPLTPMMKNYYDGCVIFIYVCSEKMYLDKNNLLKKNLIQFLLSIVY